MAPHDKFHLPFRWEFTPVRSSRDGSIRWKWRAYTHSGEQAFASRNTFETLTACMSDARERGFDRRD